MEAAELGFFMFCASLVTTLFEYPNSPVRQALPDHNLRRFLIGVCIGLIGASIIYSPFGQRTGAHFNPAVTIAFYRLGKVKRQDALFYVIFQCIGGLVGIYGAAKLLNNAFTKPPVDYIVTQPVLQNQGPAFVTEVAISFVLMLIILLVSNSRNLSKYMGAMIGCLLCAYVYFTVPVSGFGMNPARSFASAFFAQSWMAFWLYVVAPVLGMLAAAEVHRLWFKGKGINCAKLDHNNKRPCIFCCSYKDGSAVILEDLIGKR